MTALKSERDIAGGICVIDPCLDQFCRDVHGKYVKLSNNGDILMPIIIEDIPIWIKDKCELQSKHCVNWANSPTNFDSLWEKNQKIFFHSLFKTAPTERAKIMAKNTEVFYLKNRKESIVVNYMLGDSKEL